MKYKGLVINSKNSVLDKVGLTNSELGLLASGDGTEIMIQRLNENITFDIYPEENNPSLMDFFYVLEGKISFLSLNNKEKNIIKKGDYFYTRYLQEPCIFRTLSKVKMLYVSSQPIFHNLGESLKELHKINQDIDKMDNYTRSHSERVQDLSLKIGLNMGLNQDILTRLSLSALFHDLGKINIDNKILNKPNRLTSNEFKEIKKHPIISAEYVENIKYMDVSEIVLQHHERIDGSGYPNGLRGNQICIEAKIMAVADSYDAMTTNRPYRKAISQKEAIDKILKLSGKIYDSKVVNAFLKVMN